MSIDEATGSHKQIEGKQKSASIPVSIDLTIVTFLIVVSTSALHHGSSDLTIYDVLIGAGPTVLAVWTVLRWSLATHGSRRTISIPRTTLWLLLFISWATVSVVPAILNGVFLIEWVRRFVPILNFGLMTFFASIAFRSRKQVCLGIAFLITVGGLMVLASLAQADITRFATAPQTVRRFSGGYFGPMTLMLAVPLLIRISRRPPILRLVVAFGAIAGLIGTVVSFTRSYWIGTVVAIPFVFLLSHSGQERHELLFKGTWVAGLVGLSVLVLSLVSNAGDILMQRAFSMTALFQSRSFLDRVYELYGLLSTAVKRPVGIILGNGFGAKFTFYSVNPWSWGGVGYQSIWYSHNFYAYVFWTTGLVGLILFLLFLRSTFITGLRTINHATGIYQGYALALMGVVIQFSITSLTAPSLPQLEYAVYLGVEFGLLIGLADFNAATSVDND